MIPPASTLRSRLKMQHLRLLLSIEERGSLRQAADALSLSQPAVTKMLQDMEALLGVTLFERHLRGLRPTRFGMAVTRYANLVFSDLANLHDELVSLETGRIGKVRIGAVMAPTPVLMAEVIRRLKRDHPGLNMTVHVDTSDMLVPMLERDQLDLVLGRVPEGWDASHLTFEQLGDERLAVVVGCDHPLAKRTDLTFGELATYPWILQPRPSPMRALIDRSFEEAGVTAPQSTIETAAILMTTSLLTGSDLVAVVPMAVATFHASMGLLHILPVPLPRKLDPYGVVTRLGRPPSASMTLFVDVLRAVVEEGGQ
ncbi:LysR family transcriptional regulator [Burkholderia ambifaria]|uniref:LysR family transcriptional regulator n=1 Tax=Burkholderia ambifaria TaxID=152480 RepID=UPI0022A95E80|nr:LysR family transcriptional regulator [Burkholderia ambifaria]WAS52767.1 LysR family transcriptional regulator [Burkholderia ambifaria]